MTDKITDYTYEEKQRALDEANEIMKTDVEQLEGIKKYISSAKSRYTTPILNENDLNLLVRLAEKGCNDD